MFNLMTSRLSLIRFCFDVAEFFSKTHILKFQLVKMLAGDSEESLKQSAQHYSSKLLKERRVESVWSLVKDAAECGNLLLASASLEPIVAILAAETNARYVASQLESNNGILNGSYLRNLTGQKEEAIKDKYGLSPFSGCFCVISDNFSDCALLAKANKAFVVIHKGSHRKRWQSLAPTFLEISK
jgi:phosphoserine phosphatase